MIELQTEIDDAIRKDARLLPVVEQAMTLLADVVQNTDAPVSAHWQLVVIDRKNPIVRLELTQGQSVATTEYRRDRLLMMAESALDLSLIRLWGDVLEKKSHAQTRRLKEMIETINGTSEARS